MIYLDNGATTKPLKAFVDSSGDFLNSKWHNPSAIYKSAVEVKNIINSTRELAKKSFKNKYDCYFTSCGTEGASLALMGSTDFKNKTIITTKVEHPCVYNLFMHLKNKGVNVVFLNTDKYGRVDFEQYKKSLNSNVALVSIMHVNNITGAINDINALYDYAMTVNPKIVFHSDGVQGYLKTGTVPKCHLYTASGHKINALKGVGLLFVKKGFKFNGKLHGGGQEEGVRSGTENTLGIYSLNFAIDYWMNNLEKNKEHMATLKNTMIEQLKDLDDVVINSPNDGSPHILNMSFIGVGGEIMLHSLEQNNILVSTGSACSARKKDPRISNALSMKGEVAQSQVRFSFTHDTKMEDIIYTCEKIKEICKEHRLFMRRK